MTLMEELERLRLEYRVAQVERALARLRARAARHAARHGEVRPPLRRTIRELEEEAAAMRDRLRQLQPNTIT